MHSHTSPLSPFRFISNKLSMEPRPDTASLVFKVYRRTPELISPAKRTLRELKVLSDIDDQESLRARVTLIFFYRHNPSSMIKGNDNNNNDPVRVIRKALAETLVYYYPFAGRLREGPHRKLMVDCNGEGVLFAEADADVALDEFGDDLRPPFPCFEELVLDTERSIGVLDSPLLLIQVTRLKCGGFILTISFNHVMCDGTGLCLFLKTLSELARGANVPSIPPVWDRHLLMARVPANVTHAHREYKEVITDISDTIPRDHMVQRSFFFGSKEISAIRRLVPADLRGRSTSFELLTSFLWRCRTIALRPLPSSEMRLIVAMNARSHLHNPPLPHGYYGNVIAFPAAIATAKELSKRPVGFALRLVQEAKYSVTDEYVMSTVDLLANTGRLNLAFPRTYAVSDLRRTGFDGIDFGWGKPLYGGVNNGNFEYASFYIPYKNKKGVTGIVVPIILPKPAMERFAEELARVLDNECICEGSNNTKSIRSLL